MNEIANIDGLAKAADDADPMPHSIGAEQQLLGAILTNNDIYDRVASVIQPHHFFDPVHQRIFDVAAARIAKNNLASPVTLKAFMEDDEGLKELGGPAYLVRLAGAAIVLLEPEGEIARRTGPQHGHDSFVLVDGPRQLARILVDREPRPQDLLLQPGIGLHDGIVADGGREGGMEIVVFERVGRSVGSLLAALQALMDRLDAGQFHGLDPFGQFQPDHIFDRPLQLEQRRYGIAVDRHDDCSAVGPKLDEALRRENLQGFPQRRARDAEALAQGGFGDALALGELTPGDDAAQFVDHLGMEDLTFRAGLAFDDKGRGV